jgi:16S rRNA (cytosine967-C5)-methyltransferase
MTAVPAQPRPTPAHPTPAPARTSAYRVLRRVFEQGAYADRALPAETADLDARDRALAMRLVYGAVQRKSTLDHLIAQLAGRPAAKLDPPLLASLRLGLYELLYLDGSPDYAVVADAVELAKGSSPRGHGLVNAVLRRAGREGRAALLDPLSEDSPRAAAVRHSHPLWIAELWWEMLGPDPARALMAADNEPSEVALRANTLVTDAERLASELGVPSHRDPAIAEALVLDEPLDLHGSPAWERGAFVAQSRAAMLVGRALAPLPGERVLDLCAAPGGKTTHLAALMGGEGEIVAVEQNPARARELEQAARRLHASNVRVRVADAATFADDAGPFDRVLVDPPCSGLGTLQSRPDLRWRVEPSSIAELARLQARILASAAACLRSGGVLVYSTCTISSTENEDLIADFLDSHPEFALDDLPAVLPAGALSASLVAGARQSPIADRLVQTLPHRDRTAGFFIARLRRG